MNTELEQTLLEIAEAQDALNKNLNTLEKKFKSLEKSKDNVNAKIDLLLTITENHSDSICENIENIEILNEKIVAMGENLIENLKIFNSNNKKYTENIEEFNEYKESANQLITENTEDIEDFKKFFNKHLELNNSLDIKNKGIITELKGRIDYLETKNTIDAKEGDIVYFSAYGDSTKFKVVSIIGDEVILKFCRWWLPRLFGNDRYINVPKDTIYYKDKKNYIIK